jgi:CRISPR-associated endonuclease/helicase Cas3
MKFYSHLEPEKILLKDHLQYVGNRSKRIINSKTLTELDKHIISDVSYIVGISHDFGKYTTFFQEKLKGLKDKNDSLTHHGLISALFAFELVNEYLKQRKCENEKPYKFLPLIAYFIIKHHHGNLDNIETDLDRDVLFKIGFKNVNKQLKDIWINKNQIIEEYDSLLRSYHISSEKIFVNLEKYKKEIKFSDDIKSLIKELDKSLYFLIKNKENKNIIYYFLVQLLYSVLIDSDKKHAGRVMEIERKELPESLVEDYLNSSEFKEDNESNINQIRDEIRKSVLKNISDSSNIEQKIFTLTAPTGTGKTLTSFSAALILRKKLKNELNLKYEPRIIYSLPFTSIIDQNYSVFDKVLRQIEDFEKNESEYLLKHHYLSEIFYKTEDIDKEKDIDESLALIESWESEIIVTTFIQLFHTLISYKNRSLKKFHNIVNSIIILDEVQNIPVEYWKLTQEILIGITEYFNCRIILMTATKPLIFEESTYKELVDGYERYFKKDELNRVCLKIDSTERQIEEFCNKLNDWSKNSYLFVFNTIKSSLEFYDKITERIQDLGLDFKTCYLSTNIIPRERKQRINEIKEAIKNGQKVIVVSTQLIEAGVDIDCECVYRDMGPLDSIIQVAGRCNRNKRLQQSDVCLLNLVGKNNKPFTGIYDPVLLAVVRQIFADKYQIPESDFLEMINEYFEVSKTKSKVETKLIDSIYELYFYDKNPDNKRKPISEFKLIKEDYFKIDVFIELDDTAKEVWEKYQEIRKLPPLERKKEFLKIKKQFYNYVISVPKNYVGGFKEGEINHVSKDELSNYYDAETGFKREAAGEGLLIC